MSHARRKLVVLLVLAAALHGRDALCDDIDSGAARAHRDRAKAFASDGKHMEAIQELTRAYEISARPTDLFNIAAEYEAMAQNPPTKEQQNRNFVVLCLKRAVHNYQRYLEEKKDARNRAEVEGFIAKLQKEIGITPPSTATTEPPKTPPATAPAKTSSAAPTRRIAGISLAVGGGAVAIVGGVLLGHQAAVFNSANGAPTIGERNAQRESANTELAAGAALTGAGAALAIVGAVVAAIPTKKPESRATLRIAPTFGGVSVTGVF